MIFMISAIYSFRRCTAYKPSLQQSYVMYDIRRQLNPKVDIVRVENVAYCPFRETLSFFLAHTESCSLFTNFTTVRCV